MRHNDADHWQGGLIAADVMFQHAATENAILTWVLRGAGFLAMLVGIISIFRPLVTIADVLPFLGGLLGAGAGVLAFSISVPLALITIGVAWVAYRPVVGMALLAAGIAVFGLFKSIGRKPRTHQHLLEVKRPSPSGLLSRKCHDRDSRRRHFFVGIDSTL